MSEHATAYDHDADDPFADEFEDEMQDNGGDPFAGLSGAAEPGAQVGAQAGPPPVAQAGPQAGAGWDESLATSVQDRPVPRISLHAFCERPETGAAIQRAAADRRLAKAHVTVYMGGAGAAAEHYTETPTPNLILVETLQGGEGVFKELEQLAHVCDPGTKVIVIGQVNDIRLYRELIRQGVNEYLVTPLQPMQVIEAISSLYVDPDAPPIGRSFAFVSAKGGAGSSTLAHNVGWVIAESQNEDVTIVDLDLPFGTAGLDFNQDPTQGVADALSSPERLDDVLLERLLVKHSDHLSLFTAPGALDRDYDLDPEAFDTVLEVVRANVPCVIVDVPHLWSTWSKRLLLSADEIVIVTEPELAGLRNTKNLYDLLRQSRPNDAPPKIVLNRAGAPKRPEIPVKDFGEAVGAQPALTIPYDPQLFGTASNNGQMLDEVNAKAPAAEAVRELARLVTGRQLSVRKQKSGSLLGKLLGGKG